ncbi:MAG: Asp-tRNA(Asn)/Glu-tRNA(Gln) amidotransferase subunit GatC [Clostridia bacterium]|nr:Asp-tRNA(Asn)/Glu-tRNA(Gln) amidotransferase subunit GatC [Clostridia bacterium]
MATGPDTIKRIANLASLAIEEHELEGFAKDLDMIIGYMEQLSQLDTGDVKPMEHVLPLQNVLREDLALNTDRREELIQCAPEAEDGCYVVPSVVESI